jgi:hypothetical protein
MPARFRDCGLSGYRSVRFRRRFGRPRQLDAEERVWLVGEGVTGTATFYINGRRLEPYSVGADPFAFALTEPLPERNELTIDVDEGGPEAGIWGDVAIEIRRRAWLSNVKAELADGSRLTVKGAIVGEVASAFDLYVLVNGHTEAYASHGEGRFELKTNELNQGPREVRLEMIHAAVVWWVEEIEFPLA